MTDKIEQLNRQINHALRSVNSVATSVASNELEPRSENVDKVASALTLLADVQQRIFETYPELEYHYDETRPPTKYMEQFRNHLASADELSSAGHTSEALEELRNALAMEPPPLAHEMLVVKIKEVAAADND